jgi:hypothetical protein
MYGGEAGCNTLFHILEHVALQRLAQSVKSAITGCAKARCMPAIAYSEDSIMLALHVNHPSRNPIALRLTRAGARCILQSECRNVVMLHESRVALRLRCGCV